MKIFFWTVLLFLFHRRFPLVSAETVANDYCDAAEPLIMSPFIATTVLANFTFATTDVLSDDCFTGNAPVYPGLWYSVVGTGRTFVFFTCNFPNNTVLSIYQGRAGCGALQCVAGGVSPCGETAMEFFAQRGTTYYALLQSTTTNEGLLDISVFAPFCGLFSRSIFCPLTFQGVFGRLIQGILAALGFR